MTTRKLVARAGMTLLAAAALVLSFASTGAAVRAAPLGPGAIPVGPCDSTSCVSTFAFGSTRDHVKFLQAADGTWTPWLDPPDLAAAVLTYRRPLLGSEIYLTNPDLTNPRRLTDNASFDGFSALSPDGKKIVFDSARLTGCATCEFPWTLNRSDLFLMNTDGTEQTFLTHGSSATWSPDSKNIAFHASASGSGTPLRTDPGSATSDSDILIANVDDLLTGKEQPRNLTKSPHRPGIVNEDSDWSPDGKTIAYTRHVDSDNPVVSDTAEIYLLAADGTGTPKRLTYNDSEERGPSWSPDGSRIVYACRLGAPLPGNTFPRTFEICVIDVKTGDVQRLTENNVGDLTPTWSPDGSKILFHRAVGIQLSEGSPIPINPLAVQQLFVMTEKPDGTWTPAVQMTFPGDGWNNLANWGELRLMGPNAAP
jgi:TolB protein